MTLAFRLTAVVSPVQSIYWCSGRWQFQVSDPHEKLVLLVMDFRFWSTDTRTNRSSTSSVILSTRAKKQWAWFRVSYELDKQNQNLNPTPRDRLMDLWDYEARPQGESSAVDSSRGRGGGNSSDEHPSEREGWTRRWRRRQMEEIMEGRGRRRRSPQLFGVSTNIHYKFREEGEELERGRGGGGDTDKQQEVKDCWTAGGREERSKKGEFLKKYGWRRRRRSR